MMEDIGAWYYGNTDEAAEKRRRAGLLDWRTPRRRSGPLEARSAPAGPAEISADTSVSAAMEMLALRGEVIRALNDRLYRATIGTQDAVGFARRAHRSLRNGSAAEASYWLAAVIKMLTGGDCGEELDRAAAVSRATLAPARYR